MSWPLVALKKCGKIVGGATPKTTISTYWNGEIAWVTPKDLSNLNSKYIDDTPRKITEKGLKNCSAELLPAGSVLFSSRAPIGHVAINKKPMATNQGFKSVIPGPTLDANFLYWWFKAHKEKLQGLGNGATFKEVSKAVVERIEIPLPSLKEQKRIAAVLDQADAIRQARRRAIVQLNDLSQSIFCEMFGDSVKNERGWEVERLQNLATKICSGSTPVGGKKVYVDKGTVFLRSQNVWRNKLELNDVVYIDEATHKKMKKTSLKRGDILITKTGRINTENSSLGRAAMFPGEDNSANINGHVYLIRLKPEVLKEFVLYIITTPEYREYIRSVCVGGIDKRQINKEHLEEFPIIYPPVEEQQKFLKSLKIIEEQKARFVEQLDLAENLFLSVQQRAFCGDL